MDVLLVCTGNTCRSPMAAALLRARLDERGVPGVHVHSCGLISEGQPATEHGVAVMADRGLDTSAHSSRRLSAELIRRADLILGLSRKHVREVVSLATESWPRAFTLKELVRRGEAHTPRRQGQPLDDWLRAVAVGRRTTDLVGDSSTDDVADPVGGPRRAYEQTAAELDDLTARLARLIAGDAPAAEAPVAASALAEARSAATPPTTAAFERIPRRPAPVRDAPARPTHTVVDHPLVADALAELRHPDTPPDRFRAAAGRIGTLLAVEAARRLPVEAVAVPTPLGVAAGGRVVVWPLVVPILRAGLGLLDAVHTIVPGAAVALVGLRRDETTLLPERYCDTVPDDLAGRPAWVLDPMLATGGSLADTCDILADRGAGPVTALCVIAAPEGLARMAGAYPDVAVICGAVDDRLDHRGFITPGLGDAGDRLFGPGR